MLSPSSHSPLSVTGGAGVGKGGQISASLRRSPCRTSSVFSLCSSPGSTEALAMLWRKRQVKPEKWSPRAGGKNMNIIGDNYYNKYIYFSRGLGCRYPRYAGVRRVSCWAVAAAALMVSRSSVLHFSQSYRSFSRTLCLFIAFSNTDMRSCQRETREVSMC